MELEPYIAQLRDALSATASAGDPQLQRAAALLAGALEPAARLALMNALSDLAAEVTASLDGRIVEVRLDGRNVRVVVSGEPRAAEEPEEPTPPPPPPPSGDSGDISRITLRLINEIKSKAEQAAAAQGVSLNTWVSQAVQGALQGHRHHRRPGPTSGGEDDWRPGRGSRVQGWVLG